MSSLDICRVARPDSNYPITQSINRGPAVVAFEVEVLRRIAKGAFSELKRPRRREGREESREGRSSKVPRRRRTAHLYHGFSIRAGDIEKRWLEERSFPLILAAGTG